LAKKDDEDAYKNDERMKLKRIYSPPQHWFDNRKNAVYATIPDAADPTWQQENDPHTQDFHTYRHLSRYERQYRILAGHDLQLGWNGSYEFNSIDQHQQLAATHNDTTDALDYSSSFRRQKETEKSTTTSTLRIRRPIQQLSGCSTQSGLWNALC
jgi:hypothetical protein